MGIRAFSPFEREIEGGLRNKLLAFFHHFLIVPNTSLHHGAIMKGRILKIPI